MRLLTPSEQRELEAIKNKILSDDITGIDFYGKDDNLIMDFSLKGSNRDMWLNVLEMVLQTQEALKVEWYRVGNKKIDAIQAVEYRRNDNE